MPRRRLTAREPKIGYDRWTYELGDAAARLHRRVLYGSETHDAWRKGMSADAYAKTLPPAQYPQVSPRQVDPAADHERVDIAWYAASNKNAMAGGYLPFVDVDGHTHGYSYWSRGYSRDEAEQMAREMAEELASRYVGDWQVTVRPADPTDGGGESPSPGKIERDVARVTGRR